MIEVEIYAVLSFAWHVCSVLGAVFAAMLATGLSRNALQCLIALDQFALTVLIRDGMADETISAWAHRRQHKRIERCINWLSRNPYHCAEAYISEMNRTQVPKEYR